jgi:hypothetical protein
MALPFYYTVKVGSTFLTEDGLVTGTPYVSTVKGLDAVRDSITVQQFIAIDGTPIQQITQPVKGVPVTVEIPWCGRAMLDTLTAIRLAAVTGATTTTLTLYDNSDGTGDFSLTTYFNTIRFPGEFVNGKIKDVTLTFTVSAVAHLMTVTAGTLTLTGQSVTLTQA